MVHFMFQLNWALGSPDILAKFILGVSERVLLRLTFKWVDLSNADSPP